MLRRQGERLTGTKRNISYGKMFSTYFISFYFLILLILIILFSMEMNPRPKKQKKITILNLRKQSKKYTVKKKLNLKKELMMMMN